MALPVKSNAFTSGIASEVLAELASLPMFTELYHVCMYVVRPGSGREMRVRSVRFDATNMSSMLTFNEDTLPEVSPLWAINANARLGTPKKDPYFCLHIASAEEEEYPSCESVNGPPSASTTCHTVVNGVGEEDGALDGDRLGAYVVGRFVGVLDGVFVGARVWFAHKQSQGISWFKQDTFHTVSPTEEWFAEKAEATYWTVEIPIRNNRSNDPLHVVRLGI